MTETTASWLAIVNPRAGRSRRHSWPAVERELRAAGVALDVEFTREPHDGERIAYDAVLNGRHRILVAGGDGSVHDVVNGIMSAGSVHKEVTLGVAPLGTGNDWARSLDMDLPPRELAATLAAGRTKQHDVGVIDFPEETPRRRRWFVNVAGAGFDAYVISRLPVRVASPLAYLWGAISGLLTYRASRFRIQAGDQVIDQRLLVAFVANAQTCGNRMQVAPAAKVDDGLLDAVAIDSVSIPRALLKIVKLYRGTVLSDRIARHMQSAEILIAADPPARVQAEGQLIGQTPVAFSVLPGALRVTVSRR